MDEFPSTSRERIIPITIEGEKNEESTISSSVEKLSISTEIEQNKKNSNVPNCIIDKLMDNASFPPVEPILVPERVLPFWNCKEKIIFFLDRAQDESYTNFKFNNASPKPLAMLKKAIEVFLISKSAIDHKHEYVLAVLNEHSVTWLTKFTNNINELFRALNNVSSCEAEDVFDLSSLFQSILDNVTIPEVVSEENVMLPPAYVVRSVLLYGRSVTMPELKATPDIEKLLSSPFFTFDVLMTHEPVGPDNNCGRIFNVLQNLDTKRFAYFFPVARDAKFLYSSIAKLLGHPLQRPIQKLAKYNIKDDSL